MKNQVMRISIVLVAILLGASPVRNQTENRRNGNWWVSQDELAKLNYATGFFDGMQLGHNFSIWGIQEKDKSLPAIEKVVGSYYKYSNKYLSHVTAGQLVEGLDKFYSDYRNRRIELPGGVWLVTNGIAGTPEAALQKMIENWRKNAAQ